MSDEIAPEAEVAEQAAVPGVGAQLRVAREQRGLTVAQLAAQTRIGVRQLEKIEAGEFHDLPGRAYAIGFAKTYAKAVGLDQGDVADLVRLEMGDDPDTPRGMASDFTPGDPARAPSGRLVWFSVFAVLLLIVGLFFAARVIVSPQANVPTLTEQQEQEQSAAEAVRTAAAARAAQPIDSAGPVVFTAQGPVWLRLTDAAGTRLFEGEMKDGQSFTIPASAQGPKLITARPDLLAIAIGGRSVPKLAEEMRTVSDEPVDAATLLARPRPTATSTPPPAARQAAAAPATARNTAGE